MLIEYATNRTVVLVNKSNIPFAVEIASRLAIKVKAIRILRGVLVDSPLGVTAKGFLLCNNQPAKEIEMAMLTKVFTKINRVFM